MHATQMAYQSIGVREFTLFGAVEINAGELAAEMTKNT